VFDSVRTSVEFRAIRRADDDDSVGLLGREPWYLRVEERGHAKWPRPAPPRPDLTLRCHYAEWVGRDGRPRRSQASGC